MAAASALRSFQLAKSRLLRIGCTMQICSVVAGETAAKASGMPFRPSVTSAITASVTELMNSGETSVPYCSVRKAPVGATLRFTTYKHSMIVFGATKHLSKLICTLPNREVRFEKAFREAFMGEKRSITTHTSTFLKMVFSRGRFCNPCHTRLTAQMSQIAASLPLEPGCRWTASPGRPRR